MAASYLRLGARRGWRGNAPSLRGNKGRANPELVWLCLLLRPDKCQRAAVSEARMMIAIYWCLSYGAVASSPHPGCFQFVSKAFHFMCNNDVIATMTELKIARSTLAIARCCCSLEIIISLLVSEKKVCLSRWIEHLPQTWKDPVVRNRNDDLPCEGDVSLTWTQRTNRDPWKGLQAFGRTSPSVRWLRSTWKTIGRHFNLCCKQD